jgi:Cytochrome P450
VTDQLQFGERFGFLDQGKDIEGLMDSLNFIHNLLTCLGVYPKSLPLFRWLVSTFGSQKELYHQKFANDKIAVTRSETQELPQDGPVYIVKKLVDLQRKDEKKGLTDWDVSATAGANIGAGSDTTAITLGNILWYVCRSPDVLQKLRDEIEAFNLPQNPDFKTVQQMPYLQAVIKESLRLNPANGLPLWRKVPRGGATICDQYFPEGVGVSLFPTVFLRRKSANLWG